MKDNFSSVSQLYAKFRPGYPPELFTFLVSIVPGRTAAWDCGTGNGQLAGELAARFDRVYATDISENQIKNAVKKRNILYSIQPAERTSFPAQHFDLVTASQAAHWFDFDRFYRETDRTLKPGGILALIGYSHVRFHDAVDTVIDKFKSQIVGRYWDKERTYVDEEYRTIPFPYPEIELPKIVTRYEWHVENLIGYLHTWSAVRHFIDQNGSDPVERIADDLRKTWGDGSLRIATFPLFARIGKMG